MAMKSGQDGVRSIDEEQREAGGALEVRGCSQPGAGEPLRPFIIDIFFSTVVKRSTREWNVKMFCEGVRVTYMSAWTCRVSRTRKMLPCKATTEEVPSRNCQEDRRRRTWVSALVRLKEGTYVQNGFRRQCGRDRSGRDKLLWPGTGHGGSSQTGTVRGRRQWVALYPR